VFYFFKMNAYIGSFIQFFCHVGVLAYFLQSMMPQEIFVRSLSRKLFYLGLHYIRECQQNDIELLALSYTKISFEHPKIPKDYGTIDQLYKENRLSLPCPNKSKPN